MLRYVTDDIPVTFIHFEGNALARIAGEVAGRDAAAQALKINTQFGDFFFHENFNGL